jgi:AraC-like DNA-binding protein
VHVTLNWIQLVLLLAGLQGVLLAGVIITHRSNRTANRLLAALMLAFTMFLVMTVFYGTGLVRSYPHLLGISHPLPWIFGPLVYLYAVAASDRSWRFRWRHALHFAPALVDVLIWIPIYLSSGPEKIASYERFLAGDMPALLRMIDPFKYVSGLSYSIATIVHLRQHRRRIENSYSNMERVSLRWLLWLSWAAAAIWLLATSMKVAGVGSGPRDALISLAMTVLIYSIGYIGLRQPEIFRYDGATDRPPGPSSDTPPPEGTSETAERAEVRYERSGLSDIEAARLKASLLALMTRDHPYRDPDLTLPALAEQLNTTPHKLSEVLNSELSQTFYDFVNSYRVEDVRRRIAESKSAQVNMLSVAMDAGFASKSTFNQVFKKLTGQTPSTYRKALQLSS